MGRTIPSYRIATEMERSKWKFIQGKTGQEGQKGIRLNVFLFTAV